MMCQGSVRPGTDQPGCQSWATGVSSYTETWLLGGPGNANRPPPQSGALTLPEPASGSEKPLRWGHKGTHLA